MERYGTKPKKFTAEWFDYVWEYYKIHIIVALLLVAAVIYTWVSLATATRYDMELSLSLTSGIDEEAEAGIKGELEKLIEDIDGNGEINIRLINCSVPENYADAEYSSAMDSKFYLQLQGGDSYLVLVSGAMAERLESDPAIEGLFEEASGWADDDGEFSCFAYAGESEVLRRAGVLTKDVYVGVKNFIGGNNDEDDAAKRENAMSAAKYILEGM